MTYFSFFICSNCRKSTSLYETAASDINLADLDSDSKEESISRNWATRTVFLFDLPMFDSKTSECNQVEFSATFLYVFSNALILV